MSLFLQPILSKINKNSHPAIPSLKQCQNSLNNQYDKTWENKTIKSEKSITGNKIFRMNWGETFKICFSFFSSGARGAQAEPEEESAGIIAH